MISFRFYLRLLRRIKTMATRDGRKIHARGVPVVFELASCGFKWTSMLKSAMVDVVSGRLGMFSFALTLIFSLGVVSCTLDEM